MGLSIAGLFLCDITQSGRAGSDGCEGGVTRRIDSVGEVDVDDKRRATSEGSEDKLLLVELDRVESVFGLPSEILAAEVLLLIEWSARGAEYCPPLLLLLILLGLCGSNRDRSEGPFLLLI